ncbi:N-acetylmuramidase domain-containing protein [Roseitranquillus sediminis]|uniref:N-acetylmuramidase domain-containing protein n=1 Tax=Roseitranquillus sediminis TaxID=2809051 RepID=UPI0029CA5383|nr:N-acetylmuramidase domain-containing protein [Roseitranquillus sediminis]MBM9595882.1 DUF3380 domain-containing protein [Roseitranquillus sediminis]
MIKAVTAVEARGSGFIKNTDMPCILFEGHWFHKFTRGAYDNHYPHLSYAKWTKQHYKGGRGEYDRLLEAITVSDDPDPALRSTSWGLFQIMGFNHEMAGHATVREFVNAMAESEGNQLKAFVSFVEAEPELAESLRSQQWSDFASRYNGPGYKKNQYDTKLAAEFSRARIKLDEEASGDRLAFERGDTATLQSALNVALDAGLTVDGWFGDKTRQALISFQEREGLQETGRIDSETCARLGIDVSSYSLEA